MMDGQSEYYPHNEMQQIIDAAEADVWADDSDEDYVE